MRVAQNLQWQHAWETLLVLPMKSQILSAEPCREIFRCWECHTLMTQNHPKPDPDSVFELWLDLCSHLFNEKFVQNYQVSISISNTFRNRIYKRVIYLDKLHMHIFMVWIHCTTFIVLRRVRTGSILDWSRNSVVLSFCHFLSFEMMCSSIQSKKNQARYPRRVRVRNSTSHNVKKSCLTIQRKTQERYSTFHYSFSDNLHCFTPRNRSTIPPLSEWLVIQPQASKVCTWTPTSKNSLPTTCRLRPRALGLQLGI